MLINMLCLDAIGPCSTLVTIAHRQGFFARRGVDLRPVRVTGTNIPGPTPDNPVGHIGVPAALMRASNGAGLKIVACFDASRLSSCLVVSSEIRTARQLQGKRLGARVEGAAMWIHTVFALERLGLQPERDQSSIVEIGDPLDITEALERRLIAGAVLPRALCEQLTRKGYSILLDLQPCNVRGTADAVVATTSFLRDHPDIVESIVAALIEAAALALSPRQRLVALETIKAELKLTDNKAAEAGLMELVSSIVRRPYPSAERLLEMQGIMSASHPKVRSVSIKELVHDQVVRKLDQNGFIDRTYAAYGVT
jgi:ABC-type nitrate/sulfonate/bicarbonate transport system substrate-binding protein